jgi:dehydrogenase/reductase SDR family protein 12
MFGTHLGRTWKDAILDRSILFSFDRRGFERHARRFDPADLEVDLTGKNCLVTGASSGLGEATAAGLAARGAQVQLLCRDRERGEAARSRIRAATPGSKVSVAVVDLSDRDSIEKFLSRRAQGRVDVLVNNAGVMQSERLETGDGWEVTLATNLLGPVHLTERLVERLQRSPDPRVISVSSGGMLPVRLQVADPNWIRRPFDGLRAYAETKRALVVLSELWANHYAGTGIRFHSMHPGWADTPGVRNSLPRFWNHMQDRLRTARQGADTILWLAMAAPDKLGSGSFWFDRRVVPTHPLPWTRESARERRQLWHLCRGGFDVAEPRRKVA